MPPRCRRRFHATLFDAAFFAFAFRRLLIADACHYAAAAATLMSLFFAD